MAYAYQLNLPGGASAGYIQYNISPDFDSAMGIGDTFTISGKAYRKSTGIHTIYALMGGTVDGDGVLTDGVTIGSASKSISAGNTGSFSITGTITEEMAAAGGMIGFVMERYSSRAATVSNAAQAYDLVLEREPPVVTSAALSDRRTIAGGTPYARFGAYVQGQSLPRLTFGFRLDPSDSKLRASHALTVTGGTPAQDLRLTAATAAGVSEVAFDLPALNCSGTLTYTYTVTDTARGTATRTGTFAVLPYAAPTLSGFTVTRYKTQLSEEGTVDVPADDGPHIWVTLGGQVTALTGGNAWTLTLKYGEAGQVARITAGTVTGTDGQAIAYAADKTLVPDTLSASTTYEVVAELTDLMGSVQVVTLALKAGGFFNVEKNGVAVGMRSGGTAADRRFEVAEGYTAHFHGDVAPTEEIAPETLTGVATPGSQGGALTLRRVGRMVFAQGTIAFTSAAATRELCDVPESFMPAVRVTWMAAAVGSRVARLYVDRRASDDTGVLVLEWVKALNSTSNVSQAFEWIDCAGCWWADQ